MTDPQPLPEILSAVHPLSNRMWTIGPADASPVWPDVQLIVPFSRRVSDDTGAVSAAPVAPHVSGGYTVSDRLRSLLLTSEPDGTPVAGVAVTWAAGPTGDTSRLHVGAADPFDWLVSHDLGPAAYETPAPLIEQTFGRGPGGPVDDPFRAGDLLLDAPGGRLVADFSPPLATRVLAAAPLKIRVISLDGRPIPIDYLALVVVGDPGGLGQWASEAPLATGIEIGSTAITIVPLRLDDATAEVSLPIDAKEPVAIYAVRYRAAPARFTAPARRVLSPGSYRLNLLGVTSADPPNVDGEVAAPAARRLRWQLDATFRVARPDTIRPYLLSTSLGDSRLFRPETDSWNPAPHGVGLPAYRDNMVVLRFRSAFVGTIFGPLTVTISDCTEHDALLPLGTRTASPAANPDGGRTALSQTVHWLSEHGEPLPADDELSVPVPDAPAGLRHLQLDLAASDGTSLDTWQGLLSRYGRFADHVAPAIATVRTAYSSTGPVATPMCPPLPPLIDPPRLPGGRAIPAIPAIPPYPDEPASPPGDWPLPVALTGLIGALDASAGQRFVRAFLETGCRLPDEPGAAALAGLTAPVTDTGVDALVDDSGRAFALWWRTPEPLDWRRVSITMTVHHFDPAEGCPTGYSHRRPLVLAGQVLPSPDSSSALVFGALADTVTRLPRGAYRIRMICDGAAGGLAVLRDADGSTDARADVTLLVPFGRGWPTGGGDR